MTTRLALRLEFVVWTLPLRTTHRDVEASGQRNVDEYDRYRRGVACICLEGGFCPLCFHQGRIIGGVAKIAARIAGKPRIHAPPAHRLHYRGKPRVRAHYLRRTWSKRQLLSDAPFRIGQQAADAIRRPRLDADMPAPPGDAEHEDRIRPELADLRDEMRVDSGITGLEYESLGRDPETS
jgi:hypothetical protein